MQEITHNSQRYQISEEHYAVIQRAYYDMCDAEATWDSGSHTFLIQAFHQAGIKGLSKEEARTLGAQMC